MVRRCPICHKQGTLIHFGTDLLLHCKCGTLQFYTMQGKKQGTPITKSFMERKKPWVGKVVVDANLL